MPDSMYDRLGDMLSDALESGVFFADKKKTGGKNDGAGEEPPQQTDKKESVHSEDVKKNRQTSDKKSSVNQKTVYKNRQSQTKAAQNAFAVLNLAECATFDEAKKAYHEKLKYYHPDRHGAHPVLQKVAREKTRAIIAAWETIERYFAD